MIGKTLQVFVKFLKVFYDVTTKISGSLYVTSNSYFHELWGIQEFLIQWSTNVNFVLSNMFVKFYDNSQYHHQSESRLTSKSMSMEMDTIDEENLSGSILVLSRYKRRREEQNSLELKNDVDRYLSNPDEELDNFDVFTRWKANEFKYRVLAPVGGFLIFFRSSLTPKQWKLMYTKLD